MQFLRRITAGPGCGFQRPFQYPRAALVGGIALAGVALFFGANERQAGAATGETERVAIAPSRNGTTINLRDRLVVGLQARLKSEVAFVELVVAKVRTGQLPQRLVDETFFWARQKAGDGTVGRRRRPIIFFEPAMRARAQRIKVVF